MSSHHIVRDEQEPALLLLDYDPANSDLISNLLEWSPTVMTTFRLVEKFISQGFKIDVVLCPISDLDECKKQLFHYSPIKIITYNKEESPLDTSIFYLRGLKHMALNVITANISATFLSEYEIPDFALFFYQDLTKWYYCSKSKFRKWIPKGSLFYLHDKEIGNILLDSEKVVPNEKGDSFELICQNDGFLEISPNRAFWLGERIE